MYDEELHRKRVDVFTAMEPLHKIAGDWRDDPDLARQAIFHLCHVVATQQVLIGNLIGKVESKLLVQDQAPAMVACFDCKTLIPAENAIDLGPDFGNRKVCAMCHDRGLYGHIDIEA